MEKSANHPLADAILDAFTSDSSIKIDTENEIGKGLVAEHQGKEYRIGKPSTFENVPEEIENQNETLAKAGKTVVYFSENDSVVGLIAMMDLPNKDAKKVIQIF